jgi:hypothetical protein
MIAPSFLSTVNNVSQPNARAMELARALRPHLEAILRHAQVARELSDAARADGADMSFEPYYAAASGQDTPSFSDMIDAAREALCMLPPAAEGPYAA